MMVTLTKKQKQNKIKNSRTTIAAGKGMPNMLFVRTNVWRRFGFSLFQCA